MKCPYRAYDKIMNLLHNRAEKMGIPLPLTPTIIMATWPEDNQELCRLRQQIDDAERAKRRRYQLD